MDWYAWLCRAGLHPDVALDYALLFARNELVADDVRHLDHEFLATMGVAVAKHRLEILKLARKESSNYSSASRAAAAAITALPRRATRLLAAAVHRSARSALGRLRASVSSSSRGGLDGRAGSRDTPAALALAAPRLPLPARRRGGRVAHSWGKLVASPSPVAPRGGKPPLPMMLAHHVSKPVLLTSSCAATAKALPAPPATAVIAGCLTTTEALGCDDEEEDASCYADMEEEEMRWESMFQDLKPT
ncbi:hypothetical protein SEVIR_4G051300v4 [Setaria viridis]|uniref:SAM domain-containing protein n=2 Tax=Setaria TaxID=4554 RepID=A0A368QR11_SETIT|nr:uncharacterized protein LOC101760816 [Setaria italica]XP_034591113.1 uncharacterized protein LOC117852918 [Setaria viridis]RCV20406.1 hypothetical protein SETIT_4G053600v2 [Setaria italica]TKW19921.1 hypothetical protein SEVIR_4G051300v2 [Setaria viridis]